MTDWLMRMALDLMHLLMTINYLAFRVGNWMVISTMLIRSNMRLQKHPHVDFNFYKQA